MEEKKDESENGKNRETAESVQTMNLFCMDIYPTAL